MSDLTILSLLPTLLNVNGDAENAAVLAQRSRWSGHSASVVSLGLDDSTPSAAPSVVVIGSTTDVALPTVLAALHGHRAALLDWIAAGVPVVAIGTGWEVLGRTIELATGTIDGLGILPSSAVTAPTRVTDDLVVESAFGRLIGFENHARDTVLDAGATPIGRVLYGRGNGAGSTAEGLLAGSVIASHLHGPVLAKNPGLADHVLTAAIGPGYDARTVMAGRVDDIAKAARNVIATRLELGAE